MDRKLILIGGSAGSGTIINSLLKSLQKDFIIPIVIIRHKHHSDINNEYTDSLSFSYDLNIREPDDKEIIKNSTIYLAPSGYHLMIENNFTFSLNTDEAVNYNRPSIDVLMESAAFVYKTNLTAILLSGANCDGTAGLKKVIENGGTTIVQDPESAQFPEMPLSAVSKCEINNILSINEIIETIKNLANHDEVKHDF